MNGVRMARSDTELPKGQRQKYCSRCAAMMVLVRVAPRFGSLPELRTYKCLRCGCVVEEDIE
jgi:RNase P subunit RPR2